RSPVACGQGDGAAPHLIHPLVVGAAAAATAAGSFETVLRTSATVKTAALRIDDVATFAAAAQSRSGLYFAYAAVSAVSDGAFVSSSAVKSSPRLMACWLPSTMLEARTTAYVWPGVSGAPSGVRIVMWLLHTYLLRSVVASQP